MTMQWTRDQTSVDPPSMDFAAGETLTLGFDVTALLGPGDTATLPTSVLYRVDTGAVVAGLAAPSISGNIVSQQVSGIAPGITYRLRVFVVIGGNTEAMTLYIVGV